MDREDMNSMSVDFLEEDAPIDIAEAGEGSIQVDRGTQLIGLSENDVRARPFKLLRTTLNRRMSENDCQVIGVTSPSPHAGKSFIASNLAASMSYIAANGVVLADLDLQRAAIGEIFGIDQPPGIADFLLGEVDAIPPIARKVEGAALTVLPTFLRSCNTASLIASDRYAHFIEALKSFSDKATIICDLPPLFVSDDAALASQRLDGVLLVVEQGVTTKKQLEYSMSLIDPGKFIGTIFNRATGGLGDPYNYYGHYGSSYT